MPGTAVAKKDDQAAQIELAYKAIMGDAELPQIADPEIVSRAIMERILKAETFEEAFQPQQLVAWRDALLDVPVLVESFHLNTSTFEGAGAPVYAVVDLTRGDTGEALTVTCGGRNVLMQLVKMLEKGWLDKPVKMTSRDTAEGFKVLWLVAA